VSENSSPDPGSTPQALTDGLDLLALLFRGPDPARWREPLLGVLPGLPGRLPAGGLAEALAGLAALVPDAADLAAFCAGLEPVFVALFVNARGGVAAPPYQSCHESDPRRVMGPAARDMAERLAREGLAPTEPGQMPDHLCIELEYLRLLLVQGRAAEAASFAGRVMLPWCARFAAAVDRADPQGFFRAAAQVLLAALEAAARSA
jgi:TorA-specific chaperone